ncbi:MAG: hypothetical protein DRJ42_12185 [Deltaproteobacteria bacterium]|nr:MAG: hypothetical protein DRJ42_12185 [Deltaproteobacteria bacterium]
MRKRFALDVVEAAYDLDATDADWIEAVTTTVAETVPGAVLPMGHTLRRAHDGAPVVHSAYRKGSGRSHEWVDGINALVGTEFHRAIMPLGTKCVLMTESLAALPAKFQPMVEAGPLADIWAAGAKDCVSLQSMDAAGRGIAIAVHTTETVLASTARRRFEQVASHIAAASRLRQSLSKRAANGQSGVLAEPTAEAVLEVDGRIADAQGAAKDASARELLRFAVKQVDRARSKSVRHHDEEALSMWQALVGGRWSLIDRYDTDGRRHYLAIRNLPAAVLTRALSAGEARIVALAVAGESDKAIGYHLGLKPSSVATGLSEAMRRLGVKSRIELIRVGQALGAQVDETADETADAAAPSSAAK